MLIPSATGTGTSYKSLLGCLCVIAFLAPHAKADVVVEFSTTNTPPTSIGELSWAGGTSPLVATSVMAETLTAPDGTTYTADATMNFTTGAFSAVESNGDLYFGPTGSSITIDGSIPGFIGSENLLTGVLFGALFDPTLGQISVTFAAGNNTISQDLLNLVGLPLNSAFVAAAYLGTQQISNPDLVNGFSANVYEVDVKDHAVPDLEPSAWIMLLFALACSTVAVLPRRGIRQS